MTGDFPTVLFFGVRHYGSVSKLERELEEKVSDETDAIFLEKPDGSSGWKDIALALLKNPSIFAVLLLYSLITGIFAYIKNREIRAGDDMAAEWVAEKQGIEVHNVDKPLMQVLNSQGWAWAPISWLFFTVWLRLMDQAWPEGVAFSLLAVFQGLFVILVIIGYPFLISSISDRNSVMLARILRISKEENYSNVVMVTGGQHVDNFEELADEMGVENDSHRLSTFYRSVRRKIKSRVQRL